MKKELNEQFEKPSRLLIMFVIVLAIILTMNTFFLVYKVGKIRMITGQIIEGTLNFTIGSICGDSICQANENCVADASYCADNKCYEPTCTLGCGQTAVASGSTDEACTAAAGCASPPCQCDGAGTCVTTAAPVVPVAPAPAGGGAGGAIRKEVKGFEIEPEILKFSIKVEELYKRTIKIKNTGGNSLDFLIDAKELKDVLSIKESAFRLEPGQEKYIELNFISEKLDVITGRIYIRADGILKIIPVIVEVESDRVLFDVSLDLPIRQVLPGDDITGYITVYNLERKGAVEIEISYLIKDTKDATIVKERELVGIVTEVSFSKTLKIPADIEIGDYVFIVEAIYKGSFGTASETFRVGPRVEMPAPLRRTYLNILLLLVVILLLAATYWIYYQHKKLKNIEAVQKRTLKQIYKKSMKEKAPDEVISKLKKQLELLKKAYELKYISKEAFIRCEKRIAELLKEIEIKRRIKK